MNDVDLFKRFAVIEPPAFCTDLHLFIAEGNNELRLILTHHLQKVGFHNIRSARDGRDSLKELREKPVHIALVDSELPSLCAIEA